MDCVWIHPDDAREAGIKEGDRVVLENNPAFMPQLPRPVPATAHLTDRVSRNCVLTFHGIGHRAKNLRHGGNWGYRDGDLVPQKNPEMVRKHDATGMGWVEDVHVKIRKA